MGDDATHASDFRRGKAAQTESPTIGSDRPLSVYRDATFMPVVRAVA